MVKKTLSIALLAFAATAPAKAVDAYQNKQQVFEEWLILNTCMDLGKVQKDENPKVDSDALILSCVNKAKQKQALIHSK
ncbi:hypothetical protein OKZ62_001859 [Vibrio navarrensis]|nr:hypothetical protein [Vibrio navarrensis]